MHPSSTNIGTTTRQRMVSTAFPVVRPDRETTKVQIVFDASARLNEKSLNTEALPGPKLKSNICDILVRFRKELEVLVGDVSQMYHQLTDRYNDSYGKTLTWEVHRGFMSFQDSSSEGATALSVPSTHDKATLRTTRPSTLWSRKPLAITVTWTT